MRRFAFLASALLACAAFAQVPAELAPVSKKLKERFGVEIKSAERLPMGLYEAVLTNSDIVYFSADGKYFLAGQLMEFDSMRNLTQEKKDEVTRFLPAKEIPADWTFVAGNEKASEAKTIWVFTDPRCPFCKKAEPELDKLAKDYKIVYVPLAYQRSDAEVAGVLCAKDRLSAWKKAINDGQESPSTRACRDTVGKLRDFASAKGINGTPTYVLANGRRLQGYMSEAELRQAIERLAASR